MPPEGVCRTSRLSFFTIIFLLALALVSALDHLPPRPSPSEARSLRPLSNHVLPRAPSNVESLQPSSSSSDIVSLQPSSDVVSLQLSSEVESLQLLSSDVESLRPPSVESLRLPSPSVEFLRPPSSNVVTQLSSPNVATTQLLSRDAATAGLLPPSTQPTQSSASGPPRPTPPNDVLAKPEPEPRTKADSQQRGSELLRYSLHPPPAVVAVRDAPLVVHCPVRVARRLETTHDDDAAHRTAPGAHRTPAPELTSGNNPSAGPRDPHAVAQTQRRRRSSRRGVPASSARCGGSKLRTLKKRAVQRRRKRHRPTSNYVYSLHANMHDGAPGLYESANQSPEELVDVDVPEGMSVDWVGKDGSVLNDSRWRVARNGSLLISKVQMEDAGSYHCRLVFGSNVIIAHTTVLSIAATGAWMPEPLNQTAAAGGGVRLSCHLQSTPPAELAWHRDGRLLLPQPRYFWPKPGVLQIHDVSVDDAGEYWCSGYNNVTRELSNSSSGHLNVTYGYALFSEQDSSKLPSYHHTGVDETFPHGNQGGQDAYEDRFSLAKHNQSERAANYTSGFATHVIPLHPLPPGDGAGKMNNPEGSDVGSHSSAAPGLEEMGKIHSSHNTVPISTITSMTGHTQKHLSSQDREERLLPVAVKETVPIGSRAVLECITNSNKRTTLFWSRADNRSLGSGVARRGQGSLVWRSVSRADAGIYVCSWPCAHHDSHCHFRREKQYELKVLEKPTILDSALFWSLSNGMHATLRCTGVLVADLQVLWYRDGQRICHDGTHIIATTTAAGTVTSTLEIFFSTLKDKGIYQCFFVTKLSEAIAAGYVDVQQSPDALSPPRSLEVRALTSTSVELQFEYLGGRHTGRKVAFIVFYGVKNEPQEFREGECLEDDYSADRHSHQRYMQKVSNETYFSINNLQPYTTYSFFVRSVLIDTSESVDDLTTRNFLRGQTYLSEPSDALYVRTRADIPRNIPKLYIDKLSTTALQVRWTKLTVAQASGEVKEQRIQWRRASRHQLANVHILDPDVQAFNITGLIPEEEYEVIVEACTVEYPVNEWNWTKVVMVIDEPRALHLAVTGHRPTEMAVYIVVAPGTFEHVLRYLVSIKCSNRSQVEENLPSTSPRYTIYHLDPGACCNVTAEVAGVIRDVDEFKTQKSLCSSVAASRRHANATYVDKVRIKWLGETEIEVAWSVHVSMDPDRYFALYVQRLGPLKRQQTEEAETARELRELPWERLSTEPRAKISGLAEGNRYRVSVQLCSPSFCTLPAASIDFLALSTVSTPPQDVAWSPLNTSTILVRWQPPESRREQYSYYVIAYRSVYSDKRVFVPASQTEYQLEQLISNTPYNVSIATVSSNDVIGEPANFTFVITAYLQTSEINWTLYVLITLVTAEGVALFLYLCMLHKRGLLTTQHLAMVFSGCKEVVSEAGASSSPPPGLGRQPAVTHCCACNGFILPNGSSSFSKVSIERDYPLDSKGPQSSPVGHRPSPWRDARRSNTRLSKSYPLRSSHILGDAVYTRSSVDDTDEDEELHQDLLEAEIHYEKKSKSRRPPKNLPLKLERHETSNGHANGVVKSSRKEKTPTKRVNGVCRSGFNGNGVKNCKSDRLMANGDPHQCLELSSSATVLNEDKRVSSDMADHVRNGGVTFKPLVPITRSVPTESLC